MVRSARRRRMACTSLPRDVVACCRNHPVSTTPRLVSCILDFCEGALYCPPAAWLLRPSIRPFLSAGSAWSASSGRRSILPVCSPIKPSFCCTVFLRSLSLSATKSHFQFQPQTQGPRNSRQQECRLRVEPLYLPGANRIRPPAQAGQTKSALRFYRGSTGKPRHQRGFPALRGSARVLLSPPAYVRQSRSSHSVRGHAYPSERVALERAFNIVGQPELRACYDSLLADPDAPAIFPYGGFGSLLVAGEPSRDGKTFFG